MKELMYLDSFILFKRVAFVCPVCFHYIISFDEAVILN